MSLRIVAAALIAGTVALAETAAAQDTLPGDVAFTVPLNLTRLSPYIERVAVTCRFGHLIDDRRTLSNRQEFPVSAGQVVGEAMVVVAVDPYAPMFKPGETLHYECTLSGLIGSFQSGTTSSPKVPSGWFRFDDKLDPAIAVSPVPAPLTDTFEW